jgi:hypothetical protein
MHKGLLELYKYVCTATSNARTRPVQSENGATTPVGARTVIGIQVTKATCKGSPLSTMGWMGWRAGLYFLSRRAGS